MSKITVRYHFEELTIPGFGTGMMLYGFADLITNGGEVETFDIEDIKLGDKWLDRPYNRRGGYTLSTCLFSQIVEVLFNDKSTHGRLAALEWADAVEKMKEAA
ncbi:hypothetical protein [Rhizobium lentis]|uniref:hypothetical protein n=1 Tax=Rhizobium lentis TaxID=1138194 RepID=UPI001C83114E|nr:hypothetical protein [Rhizobium lentis]MBX5020404.1 hypothetical protein [Rhizobium lentis]